MKLSEILLKYVLITSCIFPLCADQINIHTSPSGETLTTDTLKLSFQDKPLNAQFRFENTSGQLMQIPVIEYEWNNRILFWSFDEKSSAEHAISDRQFTTFISYSQISQRLYKAKVHVWDSTGSTSETFDIGNMYYVLNNIELGIRQYLAINHEWSKCAFYGISLILPISKTFGDEWGRTSIYGLPSYGIHGGLYFTDNIYGGISSQLYYFRYVGVNNDLLGSDIDIRNSPIITMSTTFFFMGISFELPTTDSKRSGPIQSMTEQSKQIENSDILKTSDNISTSENLGLINYDLYPKD